MARVDQFCDNHGMNDDKVVFQKAALLAQNPHKFESYSELTEEEKVAIRRETTRACYSRASFQSPPSIMLTAARQVVSPSWPPHDRCHGVRRRRCTGEDPEKAGMSG